MGTRYSIFPSVNEDRIYYAEDFLARPARDFLAGEGDGVGRETGDSLEVTETSPASLAVDVGTGAARANGYRFEVFTSAEEVSLDAADPTDDRIDRIVVQVRTDSANRDARLHVLKGTPAGSPSAPSLTRDSDTYEISLAQVLVGAGVASVGNSDITDERSDNSVCGWLQPQVTGRIGIPMAMTDEGTDAYEFGPGGDLNTGDTFVADVDSANTTASPTAENVDGSPSGAQSIVTTEGAAFAGMLEARPHRFQWDGTNYVVLDPAGGVVDKGSGSNGEYVQYGDGTLVCTHTLTLTQSTIQRVDATWTYPKAFSSSPVVTATNIEGTFSNATPARDHILSPGFRSNSTSSVEVRVCRVTGGTDFGASDELNVYTVARSDA